MAANWHILRDGKRYGPYTGADLKKHAASGHLLPIDLVVKDGMAKPVPAAKVKGLFAPPSRPVNPSPTNSQRRPSRLDRPHAANPDGPRPPAHDAFTRLLTRLEPDPETLWTEAEPQVRRDDGIPVIDDSTLDKPYATTIELVTRHWSGKHHAVVEGIDPVSLLWTDGDRHIPCDDRVYDKADGKTKNDHFRDRIGTARARGFRPRCVAFDGWYGSLDNPKAVRGCGWVWLTRLKANRLVNEDREGTRSLSATAISADGTVVWLPGFGSVRVFGIVAPTATPHTGRPAT